MIASPTPSPSQGRLPWAFTTSPWWLFGAAGLCLGLAHADARLGFLAWAGMAVLAIALAQPQRRYLSGLALLGVLDLWVGHPWQIWSAWIYSEHRYGLATLLVVGFTLVNLVPKLLPMALGRVIAADRGWPVAAWLPAMWLLGEWLRDRSTHMAYNDWLITQSHLSPTLRVISHFGWNLGALYCLTAAALIGDAFTRRCQRLATVGGVLVALPFLLPSPPKAPETLLAQVGAVHLSSYAHPPQSCPDGIRLLIWPEQANYRRPRLTEGPGRGKRIEPPFPSHAVNHIYGLVTRTAMGWQNSLLALSPDGTVIASRAKVHLFPLTERSLFGMSLPSQFPLVAGQASARLPTPLGPVVSLICLEGLERDYIQSEAQAGTRLITISANELLFGGSELAMRQFIDVAVLLAVQNHLPLVRASLYGTAAIVDQDGTVLAQSQPGTDGVLTVKAASRVATD